MNATPAFAVALSLVASELPEGLDHDARNHIMAAYQDASSPEELLADLAASRGAQYGGAYLANAARLALGAM